MERWAKDDVTGEWEKITAILEQKPIFPRIRPEGIEPVTVTGWWWSNSLESAGNWSETTPSGYINPIRPAKMPEMSVITPIRSTPTKQEEIDKKATRDFLAECKRQQKKR